MTRPEDRDPEFTRFKAAWTNYLQIQADSIETGASAAPMPYLQAQLEPLNVKLQVAAVEIAAARDAYLIGPK